LPKRLQEIIKNEPQKLIIYINPPYAESAGLGVVFGKEGRKDIGATKIKEKYKNELGQSGKELFAQFLMRIHAEIKGCKIAEFSKLKAFTASNFLVFRQNFKAKFLKGFLSSADSFDNVSGKFPIGFKIWDTSFDKKITNSEFDVYKMFGFKDKIEMKFIGHKKITDYNGMKRLNAWLNESSVKKNGNENLVGFIYTGRNDFQHTKFVNINNKKNNENRSITKNNFILACIYLAVQKVIPADWLNDRDQFLYPNDIWQKDKEFHSDCLAYSLFHGSNNIQSQFGVNHWIPFRENEIEPREKFQSNFICDFIDGKIKTENKSDIFGTKKQDNKPIKFSKEAKAVFNCGKKLWQYYHIEAKHYETYLNDASFYDIRKFFQGEKNGKMNIKSDDEQYNILLKDLRESLKILGDKKIVPKVYEYGFLLG
jgi:hypothetical protein